MATQTEPGKCISISPLINSAIGNSKFRRLNIFLNKLANKANSKAHELPMFLATEGLGLNKKTAIHPWVRSGSASLLAKQLLKLRKNIKAKDLTFNNPLVLVAFTVAFHYFSKLPDEAITYLEKELDWKPKGLDKDTVEYLRYYVARDSKLFGSKGTSNTNKVATLAGKLVIKEILQLFSKSCERELLIRSLDRLVGSATRRNLPTHWTMKGMQIKGFLSLSIKGSQHLKNRSETLWKFFRENRQGEDMLYFIVKDVMEPYLQQIHLADTNLPLFNKTALELVKKKEKIKLLYPEW